MDETFPQIYGFYYDLGLYIGNQAAPLKKTSASSYK